MEKRCSDAAPSSLPPIRRRQCRYHGLPRHRVSKRNARPMKDRSQLAEPVLEQLADAVICTDRSGAIIRWNRASAALFAYSLDEAGQSLDLIIPEHLRPRQWSGFDTAATKGGTKLQKPPYSDACGSQKRA